MQKWRDIGVDPRHERSEVLVHKFRYSVTREGAEIFLNERPKDLSNRVDEPMNSDIICSSYN